MMSTHSPSTTLEDFLAPRSLYLAVGGVKFTADHAQYFSPRVMLWKGSLFIEAEPESMSAMNDRERSHLANEKNNMNGLISERTRTQGEKSAQLTQGSMSAMNDRERSHLANEPVQIWVFDVSRCSSYWQLQAERAGLSLYEFFLKTFNEICDGSTNYHAAIADHPWRAILSLAHMRERNLTGLVDTRHGIGALLFQQISWRAWWKCVDELEDIFVAAREKRYRPATFRRQALQLRRAAERLNIKQPAALKSASASGIQRRFGGLIKDIWQWGFQHEQNCAAKNIEMPWINFELNSFPHVKRHLDYGLREWEQIEPFLREDLDRLCRSADWTDLEKVVSLEWRLTFDDMTSHPIAIHFRHPHCLHREIGHHRTTLLQAYYSFSGSQFRKEIIASSKGMFQACISARKGADPTAKGDFVTKLGDGADHRTRSKDASHSPSAMIGQFDPIEKSPTYHEINEHPTLIVGWDLKIVERLKTPAFMVDLFGDHAADAHNLIDIENRVGVPLESYMLRSDWQPESAFVPSTYSDAQLDTNSLHASVIAAATLRPLFIYPKAVPYNQNGQSAGWQFLERTMAKWWEPRPIGDPAPSIQRDYYRMIDPDQRNYWVYKNSRGQWYMHGIFA